MKLLPVVALVGRPNVGKSTFFNRLIGANQAIVEDEPGTTRDRNYGEADWNGREFLVVDTGGIDFGAQDDIPVAIRRQAEMAMDEADVIVFMVDVRSGLTAADLDVADQLRRCGRPVILAANKAESETTRMDSAEFFNLGLGQPIAVSGMHGLNTGDLLDEIVARLPEASGGAESTDAVSRITLVGRPNVGKSSLLNAILQQDRALVSPIPGTTRDTTDTEIEVQGRRVTLVDTAGIRKRGHIDRGVEQYSVLRAMKAITRSDVALLVIDATEPTTAQDAHIAGYVWEAGKGLVIVVNKWDLVVPKDEHTMDEFTQRLRRDLQFAQDAPLLFTSALTRQRVRKILDLALEVRDRRSIRVPTARLNAVIHAALHRHQPASKAGRRLKLRYCTQVKIDPPTFVVFVNDPELVHFSYRRFLENQLRAEFGFEGTAIRLFFRDSPAASSAVERLAAQGRLPAKQPDEPAAEPVASQFDASAVTEPLAVASGRPVGSASRLHRLARKPYGSVKKERTTARQPGRDRGRKGAGR